ncbi:sugar diacid recognition domain-containing protein [Peribacillus simplex]|uniref:sugar diacid recognition domain-containing protein n=1 Tax=Peribacillus simplex TaxID=1478 RepID=UPI00366F13DD
MILEHIAQTVSEDTTKIIGYPVSISDSNGYLIGVSDPKRLGIFDKLLFKVVKRKELIYWGNEHVQNLPGIFPGVAAPIIVNGKVLGAIGIVGKIKKNEETDKYIQLVKNHIEMICHESFKKEMNSLEVKALDTLIHYLLHFDSNNIEYDLKHITRYGEMLGYDLTIKRICIIIDIDTLAINESRTHHNSLSLQQIQQELLEIVRYFFMSNKQDIFGQLNFEQFGIFKFMNSEESDIEFIKRIESTIKKFNQHLNQKYNLYAAISIGDSKSGIIGMKQSYQNASKALIAGKKTTIDPQVYHYNNWDITLEILSNELPSDFFNNLSQDLLPLINHDNFSTLATTFLVYCKYNMNLSKTARNLYIHRNSLIYRLEKIKELTSLDTSNFEHCLLLYLVIKQHKNLDGASTKGMETIRGMRGQI